MLLALLLVANIDQIVAEEMSAQELPAVAVAVVKNGELVHQKTYGEKKRGSGEAHRQ